MTEDQEKAVDTCPLAAWFAERERLVFGQVQAR
jgi:hypothetical protein